MVTLFDKMFLVAKRRASAEDIFFTKFQQKFSAEERLRKGQRDTTNLQRRNHFEKYGFSIWEEIVRFKELMDDYQK